MLSGIRPVSADGYSILFRVAWKLSRLLTAHKYVRLHCTSGDSVEDPIINRQRDRGNQAAFLNCMTGDG